MSVSKLLNQNINCTNLDVSTGITLPNSSITYPKLSIANGIVNADINTAAAIGISKLAGYPSDATKFLNGNGAWSIPTGSGGQTLVNYTVGNNSAMFTTITAAINQAITDGVGITNQKIIYVQAKSGAYTENITL